MITEEPQLDAAEIVDTAGPLEHAEPLENAEPLASAEPPESSEPLDIEQLLCDLEALLFVASEPLTIPQLERLTRRSQEDVAQALAELEARYADRGITVRVVAGGFRFATASRCREAVEAHLMPPKTSLSPAALETLAVVAYAQPATKAEIEAVRGVSVDGVVATLVERGLLVEAGRKEVVGRPILYATTPEFLAAFGLASLADLPPLPDEQQQKLIAEARAEAQALEDAGDVCERVEVVETVRDLGYTEVAAESATAAS